MSISIFSNSLFIIKRLFMKMFVIDVLNGFLVLRLIMSFYYSKSHFLEVRYTRFNSACLLKTVLSICKKQIYAWWIVRAFETSRTPIKNFETVNIEQFSLISEFKSPWSEYYHNSLHIHPNYCSEGGWRYYVYVVIKAAE